MLTKWISDVSRKHLGGHPKVSSNHILAKELSAIFHRAQAYIERCFLKTNVHVLKCVTCRRASRSSLIVTDPSSSCMQLPADIGNPSVRSRRREDPNILLILLEKWPDLHFGLLLRAFRSFAL